MHVEPHQRSLQALAEEVVQLEEQKLQARSAELKAGKQAEEMALGARKAQQQQATLATECANLRSAVESLQVRAHDVPLRAFFTEAFQLSVILLCSQVR